MKTRFPLLAAVGLVVVWGAMLFAVTLTLDVIRGFKVEMPTLTMWVIGAYHFGGSLRLPLLGGGLVLPTLVLATAVLLYLRQLAGWKIALALCVGCDLMGLGLILPMIALTNSLSATPFPIPRSIGSIPGIWLALLALALNQLLFAFLLFKRREFLVPPQSDGSLLAVK